MTTAAAELQIARLWSDSTIDRCGLQALLADCGNISVAASDGGESDHVEPVEAARIGLDRLQLPRPR
jgi:hypothetical protein